MSKNYDLCLIGKKFKKHEGIWSAKICSMSIFPHVLFSCLEVGINLMASQLVVFLSYYKFSELLLFFPRVAVQILIGKDGI